MVTTLKVSFRYYYRSSWNNKITKFWINENFRQYYCLLKPNQKFLVRHFGFLKKIRPFFTDFFSAFFNSFHYFVTLRSWADWYAWTYFYLDNWSDIRKKLFYWLLKYDTANTDIQVFASLRMFIGSTMGLIIFNWLAFAWINIYMIRVSMICFESSSF